MLGRSPNEILDAHPFNQPTGTPNKELHRLLKAIGIFVDVAALKRLPGAILLKASNKWLVGRRHFSLESVRKLSEREDLLTSTPVPLRLDPVH